MNAQSILIVVLGAMTILSGLLLLGSAWLEKGVKFEGHWGGFGNASGGWTLSRALTYLIATLLFGTLFTVAASMDIQGMLRSKKPEQSGSGNPPSTASSAPPVPSGASSAPAVPSSTPDAKR